LLSLSLNADSLDLQSSITLFLPLLHLASCVLGLTKCAFVLCALFARLRSIATIVVQDVALWTLELVLYSAQYACMIITSVTFMGTHVTALELHNAWKIAATTSSAIEIIRVLQESLSLGVVLAFDRQPRQHITLHQLKELGM
jgi:hypothetical protein